MTKGLRKVGTLIKNEAKKRCPKGGPRTGNKAGKKHLRDTIRRDTSPRHVPAKIIAAPDLPRTLSGKKMELPVKKILLDPS